MAIQTPTGDALPARGPARRRKSLRRQIWEARWCYLFMLPSLLLACLFTFYPTVASWYFSLLDWSGFTAERTFVGLANYAEVIRDGYFWSAFGRSFLFMAVSVPIKLSLALVVAIVLNDRALRLAPLFRTLFFLPVVTTTAIVGLVMSFVLSPFNGPLNKILLTLGLVGGPIDFLGSPQLALWSVIGVEIWKWFGIAMVYWLAGLQTIPADLYEAAKVDGAGWWQLFRYITVPLLVPFGVVITLIIAVNTLHVFPLVLTMTGGGPFFASEVMEVYIFRTAFGGEMGSSVPRLGYASAAGVVFGLSIMWLAILQWLAAQRMRRVRGDAGTEGN